MKTLKAVLNEFDIWYVAAFGGLIIFHSLLFMPEMLTENGLKAFGMFESYIIGFLTGFMITNVLFVALLTIKKMRHKEDEQDEQRQK